ncbi:DNA-binding FadR family transcriptional regulator [Thermosporothrix hazakensis]|uniref:DNA-binding FadR family transcriptional regulator n=2 Tax=Thermosporothrix TaxID=768650 RepID=A0A326U5K3_THEHA|nr:FadR/GntR family transcriptional regulator [Thermosporothrix hazakensis]PZW27974.1 DNA-binding FadR family transcriptional regulator [Thermosporothrix hazakensis]BBH86904.1 GntR family transcriptional regulator [Thermosporothrix sp. COM3]GCE51197.1 GntR family transcriptional regulator [Thermosporothrix hazakensis]
MPKDFSPLQYKTLPAQIAHSIGIRIMRHDFQPGDILAREPELSAQLNVSRSVVREALKLLSAKGLIESRPKIGTRVRPRAEWNLLDPDVIAWQSEAGPDLHFLLDICEIRLMFEPRTAALAAIRGSAEEIAAIEQSCRLLQNALHSVEEYTEADILFHISIATAAHNDFLCTIVKTLDMPLRISRLITSQLPGANEEAMPMHRAIGEAISQRNAPEAEAAMRTLIERTTEDIRRLFKA